MAHSFAESPEFVRLVAGHDDVSLARIALEIARDAYPEVEIDVYLERIREFAERIRARCRAGAKVRDIVGQINWVLFVEEEFRGNREEYYDPRNSYLNEVLDRRLGIPISLSVLYWALAERLGVSISAANLPGHFMLRLDLDGKPWFVDAFAEGALYERDQAERKLSEFAGRPVALTESMIAACSKRVVVTRLLLNLKSIYSRSQELTSLLHVQRRLTFLNVDEPSELRDLGILCARMQLLGEAVDPLREYVNMQPQSDDAEQMKELLKFVCRQLADWN